MKTLEAVVTQGRLYTREQLDAARRAYRRRHGSFVFDRVSMFATRRVMKGLSAPEP
jgi:hypothetical protein